MRFVKRQSDFQTSFGNPWEADLPKVSESVLTDKKRRQGIFETKGWIFYSPYEGINPGLRISDAKGDENGNPTHLVHGFVIDIDRPFDEELIADFVGRCVYKPNLIEESLGGNWRAIWLLDEPVLAPDNDTIFREWLVSIREQIIPGTIPGFDEAAWRNPALFFARGRRAIPVALEGSETYLTAAHLQGIILGHLRKSSRGHASQGPAIPLNVIEPLLREKYPGFQDWPGAFELGSMGPSFWVPGSKSVKSAVVHDTGLYTFSQSAGKAFWSWRELLGAAAIQQFLEKRIVDVCGGIYANRKQPGSYYRQDAAEVWSVLRETDLKRLLVADKGVCAERRKGENISEFEECLNHIRHNKAIDGLAPLLYVCPEGAILEDVNITQGKRLLNIARHKVLRPAPLDARLLAHWGEKGGFPFISKVIDHLFPNPNTKRYFLQYTKILLEQCWNYQLAPGQVLYVMGKPNSGKTLLFSVIFGEIFGGTGDCTKMLSGEEPFGSHLFENVLLVSNDPTSSRDPDKVAQWTQNAKAFAANPTHDYHEKFCIPVRIKTGIRLAVTMNDDRKSRLALPDLRQSTDDKFCFLRCTDHPIEGLGGFAENLAKVRAEAPLFLLHLKLLEVDPEYQKTPNAKRFGIDTYLDETMVRYSNAVHCDIGLLEAVVNICDKLEDPMEFTAATFWDAVREVAPYLNRRNPNSMANALMDIAERNLISTDALQVSSSPNDLAPDVESVSIKIFPCKKGAVLK